MTASPHTKRSWPMLTAELAVPGKDHGLRRWLARKLGHQHSRALNELEQLRASAALRRVLAEQLDHEADACLAELATSLPRFVQARPFWE